MKRPLFTLLTATTLALLALIAFHAIRIKHSGGYVNQHGMEQFSKWKAQPFLAISSSDDFHAVVTNQVRVQTASSSWSVEQQDELAESVYTFILAFSSGKYEDYAKFRFPIKEGLFDSNRIDNLYNS